MARRPPAETMHELREGLRLLDISERLLTSINSDWSGFRLDIYRLHANSVLENTYISNATVALVRAGRADVRIHIGGEELKLVAEPGRIGILPPEYEITAASWSEDLEVAYVEVGGPLLREVVSDRSDPYRLRLSARHGISDPQLQGLIRNMRAELLAQCPAGHIYAESLSLALAAYLANRYSVIEPEVDKRRPRLSTSQLRLVREYIQENLASNPSLTQLAAVARLSPYYFSRLFKHTTGITPYQYVLRKRIGESKRLLRSENMSIAEIALAVGFASQSHFTDVFRKTTGRTPKRERRRLQDSPRFEDLAL